MNPMQRSETLRGILIGVLGLLRRSGPGAQIIDKGAVIALRSSP